MTRSSRTEYAFSDSSIDELVHSESRGGALNELSYTRDGSRIVFTLENGGSVVLFWRSAEHRFCCRWLRPRSL